MAVSEETPAKRVEVRVDGRVRFSQECWDVDLRQEDDVLKLTAALHPTLVEVAKRPPQVYEFREDPRDGEEVIQQVHSGKRTPAKASAKKAVAEDPQLPEEGS